MSRPSGDPLSFLYCSYECLFLQILPKSKDFGDLASGLSIACRLLAFGVFDLVFEKSYRGRHVLEGIFWRCRFWLEISRGLVGCHRGLFWWESLLCRLVRKDWPQDYQLLQRFCLFQVSLTFFLLLRFHILRIENRKFLFGFQIVFLILLNHCLILFFLAGLFYDLFFESHAVFLVYHKLILIFLQ